MSFFNPFRRGATRGADPATGAQHAFSGGAGRRTDGGGEQEHEYEEPIRLVVKFGRDR